MLLNCEQDKWRNINVTAIWGSRQKAKLALKRNLPGPKIDNNHMALSTVVRHDEVLDTKPLAVSGGPLQSPNLKEQISRLQNTQLNISASYHLEKIDYLWCWICLILFMNSIWILYTCGRYPY